MADITIIMPSFNKEKYIKEALDSVFMQKTNYDFHIIAADDHSTDGTIDIIKEYQQKYPGKITLLTSEANQKLYINVRRAYAMTKTDYFCVLDPDDFWIDEYKIQKALDFLEKNKEYTIYVTDTMLQHPDGRREKYIKRKRVTDSDFQGFLNKKAALGCTLGSVYRNVIFKNGLPEKMTVPISETSYKTFRGDAFRNAVHLHEGKAHCVPFEDAVYRVTEEGLWMGSSKFSQGILTASLNRDLWLYYDKKYPQFLLKSYLAFNSVKDLLADELLKADNNALPPEVKTAVSLYRLYKENMPIIEEMFQKQIPLRYKIRRHICRAIGAKLKKKGLV